MGRRKEPQKREEEEAKQKDGKKAGRSGLGTIKQRGKDKDKTTWFGDSICGRDLDVI